MPLTSDSGSSASPLPERIGPYRVLRLLGQGGMGAVYLGQRPGQDAVAIKVIHPHLRDKEAIALEFLQEARLAARIDHPHVVKVLDLGDSPQGIFLVLEYVDGVSLSSLVRRLAARGERLDAGVGLAILLDGLKGLQAAHELVDENGRPQRLVHRDFTPQNLMVGRDGVTRLTDFGIARAISRVNLTQSGLVKGKVPYMAPEQVRGMPVDLRTDLWAAGAVAFELFAGRRLHPGDDDVGIMFRIVSEDAPSLASVRPDFPAALVRVVDRALSRDAAQRHQSAAELSRELRYAWPGGAPPSTPEGVRVVVERTAAADPAPGLNTHLAPTRLEPPRAAPGARQGRGRSRVLLLASSGAAVLALGLWGLRPGAPQAPAPSTPVEQAAQAPAAAGPDPAAVPGEAAVVVEVEVEVEDAHQLSVRRPPTAPARVRPPRRRAPAPAPKLPLADNPYVKKGE